SKHVERLHNSLRCFCIPVHTENNEPLRYPSKSKQRTIKVFVEKTDNEWIVVRDARAPFAHTLKPRPNLTNIA
ncbi:hypothetical protein L9F63_010821, partial [Diploptera punctata]